MRSHAAAVISVMCLVGCEAETGEWLEPTLIQATPSPFIAIDGDVLDDVMTPRWRKGDWWVIEAYYWTDGDFGRNEWQHSRERFEVTEVPTPALDFYQVTVETIGLEARDHFRHFFALRREPLSVAFSKSGGSYFANEHWRDIYDGRISSGRHPYTPGSDTTRPLGFPSRAGMHHSYLERGDRARYRQSVVAAGDQVVFHAVPTDEALDAHTHTFEWRRGDPWWSTYRRSIQVLAKNGPPGAFAEEVLGVARLLSVGGKSTGYAMPKREPPPEEDKY